MAICLSFAIGSYFWRQTLGYNNYYLEMDVYGNTNGNYQNGFVYVIILFITFWILLSYLVPISLFVTIEIVKFILVRCGLSFSLYQWRHTRQHAAGGLTLLIFSATSM